MKNPSSLYLEELSNVSLNSLEEAVSFIHDESMTFDREKMYVISLDNQYKPLSINLAHIGTVDSSIAMPRDILKPAILSEAKYVAVLHNHPSGDPTPSNEDMNFTEKMKDACNLVGIELYDHYVLGYQNRRVSILNKPFPETEITDIEKTTAIVDVRVKNAVDGVVASSITNRDKFMELGASFIKDKHKNSVYILNLGTKNQLLSASAMSFKTFQKAESRQKLLKKSILSNASRVGVFYNQSLLSQEQFNDLERFVNHINTEYEQLRINVLDSFVSYGDQLMSINELSEDRRYSLNGFIDKCIEEERLVAEKNNEYSSKDASISLGVEEAKKIPILSVCDALNMEMIKNSNREYYWQEHDSFKINTSKNVFSWFSRDIHGDVIKLVQTVKDVSFKEAMNFLETGEFSKDAVVQETIKEPFKYVLQPYESELKQGREYLKNVRGLSEETIAFFEQRGVLAQANRKAKDGYEESVIVFKTLNSNGEITGGSVQGITENKERYPGKGYLKQIMYNSENLSGFNVEIGKPDKMIVFESPIDMMSYYDLNKGELSNTLLVSMDGLKDRTLSRYFMELHAKMSDTEYTPDLDKVGNSLSVVAKNTTYFDDPSNQHRIVLAVDNDDAGRRFAQKLTDMGVKFKLELPPNELEKDKTDWNDVLRERNTIKTKALEKSQELNDDRTSGGTDYLQQNAEGSIKPESFKDSFEQTVTSHPTSSYPLLHFSTSFEKVQNRIGNYHPVTDSDIKRLNQYAPSIQTTAQWYLNELADRRINYVYLDNGKESLLQVDFKKENFIHLAGIRPFEQGKQAGDFLIDLAQGRGSFDRLLISNAIKDKLQVMPMLSDILDSQSFVLNDLSSVEKLHKLDFSEAIKSKDEDFLLLFKDSESGVIPASLMKLKGILSEKIENIEEKIILGIYREQNGIVEQLSINDKFIKDGGEKMMDLIKQNQESNVRFDSVNHVTDLEKSRDNDGDGLSNAEEITMGTDPNNIRSNIRQKEIENTPEEISISQLIQENNLTKLTEHLKEGMIEYRNSDKYKEYLNVMSKFYHYSPLNIQLLLKQKPNASLVASYGKWQKEFERHVKKGEKGIKIRVPILTTEKDERGNPLVDEKGIEKKKISGYVLKPVFDISQTDGKELEKPIHLLEDNVVDFQNIYRATKFVAEQNGVSISFGEIGDANGYFSPDENKIVISNRGMSESQIMKTIFHELAHAELHKTGSVNMHSDEYALHELEAESIAYVVSNHYGIDSSQYSFGYLHAWSKDKIDYSDIEKSLMSIRDESKNLIEKIDNTLEKIKSKSIKQDKFLDKLERAKNKQENVLSEKLNRDTNIKKEQAPKLDK